MHRWILTAHERAAMTRACYTLGETADNVNAQVSHKDCGRLRRRRDLRDVQKMADLLTTWGNPFLHAGAEIVGLSSRARATAKINHDLLRAYDVGNAALTAFVNDRVTGGDVPFFDPLQAHKLSTFSSMAKTTKKSTSRVSMS